MPRILGVEDDLRACSPSGRATTRAWSSRRCSRAGSRRHAFEAHADDPGEPYAIAVPPPNVTGALHMGHALNGSIQDVLIRLQRMRGRNALWIYGTDHAGIATQMVVERLLVSEGSNRHELGREGFVERVWKWREDTGTTITGQYLRLGASLDFRRERFTMDESYARAVVKVFVELYRKGYLFRDNRMINWSPGLLTAISDLEVEYRDVEDVMYEIDYPLVGGGHLTVATVRPVTLLGDTAIAVNPTDERYRDLIGRTAIVPLAEREVPIIADDYVDVALGTGALKVTPAHDPNDFEIGRRHGLAEIQVIGFDGRMTAAAGERYAGLTVAEASQRVLEDLRERGLRALRAAVPALGRALPALRHARRAAGVAAVVLPHGRAGRARDRRGARGPRALPSEERRAHLLRLDGADPPLVRVAPALVGPPAAGLVLRERPRDRAGDGARALPRVRHPPARARPRRARHLVLVGALAVRHARLARGHARPAHLLPGQRALDRPRDHQPLGRADDDDGHRVPRRAARSPTSSSTRSCRRRTAAACRSRSARASTRSS